ncbi:hypothetical protein M408DRAFT_327926 [Serendipita vermifera MAFF 305830]|uniref:RING-type domain-containing protein n=1 Tax=Serendipita vermifera MAFF 305830 TaxID=933852 RepID=A0A0C3BFR4_SERVB|nr:hypothetical protein M408DRAFT_327926 [Serendipita vermifera MAFF 305830]
MGNTSSSTKTAETRVDHGYLTPHGIYTGPIDWNQHVVGHLILERRLAPFYRPLEDYDESWDEETILANRKGPPFDGETTAGANTAAQDHQHRHGRAQQQRSAREVQRIPSEAQIYRGASECPICFMYYPPNINHSRCCFQAICTECFVQIKRNEPTPTHLVSEPACCPYCQQENFGITYAPPPWRTGLVSENARPEMLKSSSSASDPARRKSLSHDSPNVVTIDQIRPDWEERLAAVKAAVARRANRRIIMRQVGDRLIPVGVTSSRTQLPEGITTVEDIEELMLMEAMRLSLLDQPANASAPSTSARPAASSNSAAPSPRSGGSSLPAPSAADDTQRRSGRNPSISTLAVPLANASNLIAMSTAGIPSSAVRDNNDSNDATTTPDRPSEAGSSSAISSLRERLSSHSSTHRRTDSVPPPSTTLAAAIHANQTVNAFLHPRSADGGAEESAGGSTSEGSGTRSSSDTAPDRKDREAVNGPTTGEDSALAH